MFFPSPNRKNARVVDNLQLPADYSAKLVIAASCRFFVAQKTEVSAISKGQYNNTDARTKEVRLIGSDGSQLGIFKFEDAAKKANDCDLDLVEIAPYAKPPVYKIMDYGKYKFEQEKKEKEQRKKRQIIELKEIQLKCRIDTHDFNTKLNHGLKFLSEGNKIKAVIRFSGREITRPENGRLLLMRFAEGASEFGTIEKQPLLEGRNMIMILAPKKATTPKGNKDDGKDQNTQGDGKTL